MLSRFCLPWEYLHRVDPLFLKELYLSTTEKTAGTKYRALFWQSHDLSSAILMGFQHFFVAFLVENLNITPRRSCVTVARTERFNLVKPCTAKDKRTISASAVAAKLAVLRYLHRTSLRFQKFILIFCIKAVSLLLDSFCEMIFVSFLMEETT